MSFDHFTSNFTYHCCVRDQHTPQILSLSGWLATPVHLPCIWYADLTILIFQFYLPVYKDPLTSYNSLHYITLHSSYFIVADSKKTVMAQ